MPPNLLLLWRGGIGHMRKQFQLDFEKTNWKFRFSHGGILRNLRKGRGARPLSGKDPLHLVLKANREYLRGGLRTYRRYFLIQKIIDRYSRKFFVKIEQVSIQNDHVHFLVRSARRAQLQNFFRVVSGQIAQQFQKQELLNMREVSVIGTRGALKLWKYRPFTRVVRGWKAYNVVRNYVRLNEQEALGNIPYRKERLKGLSAGEWQALWA